MGSSKGTPQLGMFKDDDGDENDIPELNKCPYCGAFFQSSVCPICKKLCPEEMRAGNRVAVKKKRKKVRQKGYKVPPVWYLRTWVILLALFFFRGLGLILVWLSDWKKWVKITVTVLALLYTFAPLYPQDLIEMIFYKEPEYVDYSISEGEYREKCSPCNYEELVRYANKNHGKYVYLNAYVEKSVSYYGVNYYLCIDADGNKYIMRDCRENPDVGVIIGDTVAFYGEFAGVSSGIEISESMNELIPHINTAYIKIVQ